MKKFIEFINESKNNIEFVDYSKLPFFKNNDELSNKKFYFCDFTKQEFGDMKIDNSEFIECIFDNTSMGFTTFTNCKFEKCSFENLYANEVSFVDCKFIKTEIEPQKRLYINKS